MLSGIRYPELNNHGLLSGLRFPVSPTDVSTFVHDPDNLSRQSVADLLRLAAHKDVDESSADVENSNRLRQQHVIKVANEVLRLKREIEKGRFLAYIFEEGHTWAAI